MMDTEMPIWEIKSQWQWNILVKTRSLSKDCNGKFKERKQYKFKPLDIQLMAPLEIQKFCLPWQSNISYRCRPNVFKIKPKLCQLNSLSFQAFYVQLRTWERRVRSEYCVDNIGMDSLIPYIILKRQRSTKPALPAAVTLLLHPLAEEFIFQFLEIM